MKAIVSIITVNYNGFIDTCEMIESFHKYETYPYEIIVVDNGSHMPEGEELQKKYPDIVVIKNTASIPMNYETSLEVQDSARN